MPRPCCASATRKATSADSGSSSARSYRPTPTISSSSKTPNAIRSHVVDRGEVLELLGGQLILGAEEPVVARLGTGVLEERKE